MDGVLDILNDLRTREMIRGQFLGLLHVLIGRRVSRADGTVLSNGVSWRQLAELLKRVRWDREAAREVGLNPDDLPPRDRQRFWYAVIAAARVDSPTAKLAGEELAGRLLPLGYAVGPAPGDAPVPPA